MSSVRYHKYEGDYPVSVNETLQYIADNSLRVTAVQEKLILATQKHPYAIMMGDPSEIQFLQNLLRAVNAKKLLEVGVFTGFSTLSFALAIPDDGTIVAMDVTEEFPNIGKPYWKEAGIDKKIDLRIGPAAETMQKMIDNGESGTYDFGFIDADKESYDTYYEQCLKLLRPGGIIALDNTLWKGQVVDSSEQSSGTVAIRNINTKIHKDDRVHVSMMWLGDGTTLAFKK